MVKILQSIHIKRFEFKKTGANDEIRTRDLRFTKPLLYQLSYIGVGVGGFLCLKSGSEGGLPFRG